MPRIKQVKTEKPSFINVEVSQKTHDELIKLKSAFNVKSQKEVIERAVAIASAISDATPK